MNLLSFVATHSDVDLETIARLSAGSSEVGTSVLETGHPLMGAVVLATCNRYEVYCELPPSGEVEPSRAAMITQISRSSGIEEDVVSRSVTVNTGGAVAQHLFAVAAGLDSAVVGEREIAGQVRRALIDAQQRGTASGALTRLFQSASRTAKDVGSQTALGARGLSIVSVALELAADLALDRSWTGKQVVLFGTGAYAGATMSLLRARGCSPVSVFSSSGRAEAFVSTRGGTALTDQSVRAALADADVVIGCSGADSRIEATQIEALRAGVSKPLIILDLALTRDFDPAVGDLDGVDLITLESVRLAAPQEQVEALTQAREIVAAAARSFEHEQQSRSVDTAIVALRKHTHSVLEIELERVRAQHGCTAAAEEVEFALRRMVKQLLHIPTVRGRELAKSGEQDSYIAAIEALYGITVEETSARAPLAEAPSELTAADTSSPHADSFAAQASCPVHVREATA